jgi:PIN domain nuclease of toxin-antitoxin system
LPVLLDTHAFLWWCEDSPELSQKARKAMAANDCFVSFASFWEIAIKISLNKLRLPAASPGRYLTDQMSLNGFEQLEISFRQIMRLSSLERHHGDPFDRMLVAQAQEEGLAIVSRDPAFDRYGVKRIW